MPIYEYRCQACGARFDKLIRSLKRLPAEINCPTCDSAEVNRLISAPTIRTGGTSSLTEAAETASTGSSETPVVGRKEIEAAQKKKRELKERAKYKDWD